MIWPNIVIVAAFIAIGRFVVSRMRELTSDYNSYVRDVNCFTGRNS